VRLSCVVFWTEPAGKALHRRADCPTLRRETVTGIMAGRGGDGTDGQRLLSADLDATVTSSNDPYPPDELAPCETCG
jgi:hypothetical protein